MIDTDKKAVFILKKLCEDFGLQHAVISPGSRNAPITISFAKSDKIECISISDERSAAFIALGIAQQTKKPVAVICTSGSALLNYYPAVSEAYYQKIPLLIISADRPTAMVGQADGQTINQQNVYQNHIKKSFQFPDEPLDTQAEWYAARIVSEAFYHLHQPFAGPVHINIPLKEPLYNETEFSVAETSAIKQIKSLKIERNIAFDDLELLSKKINSSKKVMLILGQLNKNKIIKKGIEKLETFNQIIVLNENTSNNFTKNSISCIDRTLATIKEDELENFQPDLLITLGTNIVSKKIKAFLRKNKAQEHWHVGIGEANLDTFQSLTLNIEISPENFMEMISDKVKNEENATFKAHWQTNSKIAERLGMEYVQQENSFCDLNVFNHIIEKFPENSHIHWANSSPVRYGQLFNPREDLNYYCNRGTSGIDGSSSTAVGAALVNPENHFIITGDVSFFYDSNAFWNNVVPDNLKVILINNSGGGIFRIIDTPNNKAISDKFFVTENQQNAKDLSTSFGFNYFHANDEQSLNSEFEKFISESKKSIIEIFTDSETSAATLKNFFAHIKKNI